MLTKHQPLFDFRPIFSMEARIELDNFYNNGFGWICQPCERELKSEKDVSDKQVSRLMSEGEAESKQPRFSNLALAKWTDAAKRNLICPRCGIIEAVDKF